MSLLIIKRAIFEAEFSKIILLDDILLKIDESSISRNTRASISWSIRGLASEWKSINVIESISLISWNSSTGWHFNHACNRSINSKIFNEFVTDLSKFMHSILQEKGRRSMLLLDNAPIHKQKNVQEVLLKIFNVVIYLPAYSPPFAPMEHYFSVVKNNIIRLHKGVLWECRPIE